MPKVILIRPCRTNGTQENILLGRLDADLNHLGHAEADRIADRLQSWDVSFTAVSPLKRAISTAMPFCEAFSLTPRLSPSFQGIDLGDWQGLSPESIQHQDGGRFHSFLSDPDFPAPGGESVRDVYGRAFPELVQLVNYASPGETICMVVQDVVLRVLCCGLLDLPLSAANRFKIENGGICLFERLYPEGPYQLERWNDERHLQPQTGDIAAAMDY